MTCYVIGIAFKCLFIYSFFVSDFFSSSVFILLCYLCYIIFSYFFIPTVIGGVDDLARRVDTLRKKNKRFSLKMHSTVSLSIDSDYSFGDSSSPTNSGQSEPETPEVDHDNNANGLLDAIVETDTI